MEKTTRLKSANMIVKRRVVMDYRRRTVSSFQRFADEGHTLLVRLAGISSMLWVLDSEARNLKVPLLVQIQFYVLNI